MLMAPKPLSSICPTNRLCFALRRERKRVPTMGKKKKQPLSNRILDLSLEVKSIVLFSACALDPREILFSFTKRHLRIKPRLVPNFSSQVPPTGRSHFGERGKRICHRIRWQGHICQWQSHQKRTTQGERGRKILLRAECRGAKSL